MAGRHVRSVQGDHYKLIREIGAASVVLLKNTAGALPLSAANIKRASARLTAARTPPVLIFCRAGLAIVGSDAGPNPDGPNGCSE